MTDKRLRSATNWMSCLRSGSWPSPAATKTPTMPHGWLPTQCTSYWSVVIPWKEKIWLSERQKMEVDFRSDVSSPLPFEIGLSRFRVLQEALNNAVKHSGVKRVEVQVVEQSNEVHLLVRDSGNGFDIEVARQGSGLGLTSMQERVRLVNGTIAFESKPMAGTTIHVRVPFKSEHIAQQNRKNCRPRPRHVVDG